MDIKEKIIDIKDNSLPDPNTLIDEPEYANIDVKIEKDSMKDFNGTSIQNGFAANVKQEINIEAITLSNGIRSTSEKYSANSNEFPMQQTFKIKEEMDVKDVCLLDTTNGNVLHEAQYNAIDVKIEEDPADLSEASILKGSSVDIQEEREIEATTSLDKHLVTHSDHSDFKCAICHKNFKTKRTLNAHSVTHSNKYDFECSICHKQFKRKRDLNSHLVSHSDHYGFECDICHKNFKSRHTLKSHSFTHSNKYDYECDICGRKFKQKTSLKMHLMVHSDRDLKCDICHKKFKYRTHLKSHLVIHSDHYDFECDICHKKFKRKIDLSKHSVSKNCDLECNICLIKFWRPQHLQSHLAIHSEMNNSS